MKEFRNFDIYNHNTMRMHCIVDCVFFPETIDEFIEICFKYRNIKIIAAGSNVLLPAKIKSKVVVLTKIKDEYKYIEGTNEVICNASTRIQTLINKSKALNLGGIEFLYSVPCTVGGAIFMNAGRGEIYNQNIGQYVKWVECYNLITNKIECVSVQDCGFKHRESIFQNKDRVILRACFNFDQIPTSNIELRIKERILHAKDVLDSGYPSCGSIFVNSNHKIMKAIMGLRIGGAKWSSKTENWISNDKNGTYWNIRFLIMIAQLLHKLTGQYCKREIEIWK